MTSRLSVIDELIDALCCLPGVGPRSAQRMAYHLLIGQRQKGLHLAKSLTNAMEQVVHCQVCHNLTSQPTCHLCDNPKRNTEQLCIVEMPSDVLAIEEAGVYQGCYFVLMGRLSPLDGIGPKELNIEKLLRLFPGEINEVIFAINPTVEGEATRYYLEQQLEPFSVKLTALASGIPIGSELEYMNANTIGNALLKRRALDDVE